MVYVWVDRVATRYGPLQCFICVEPSVTRCGCVYISALSPLRHSGSPRGDRIRSTAVNIKTGASNWAGIEDTICSTLGLPLYLNVLPLIGTEGHEGSRRGRRGEGKVCVRWGGGGRGGRTESGGRAVATYRIFTHDRVFDVKVNKSEPAIDNTVTEPDGMSTLLFYCSWVGLLKDNYNENSFRAPGAVL